MKRRVTQMEEEARRLIELQSQVELGSSSGSIGANKEETDLRSVYVGNVRFSASQFQKKFIHNNISIPNTWLRLITEQHQRNCRHTSNHVVPLTESQSCAISSLAILKGMCWVGLWVSLKPHF